MGIILVVLDALANLATIVEFCLKRWKARKRKVSEAPTDGKREIEKRAGGNRP